MRRRVSAGVFGLNGRYGRVGLIHFPRGKYGAFSRRRNCQTDPEDGRGGSGCRPGDDGNIVESLVAAYSLFQGSQDWLKATGRRKWF